MIRIAPGVDAGHRRLLRQRVYLDVALVVEHHPERLDDRDLPLRGARKQDIERHGRTPFQLDPLEARAVPGEARDAALLDAHARAFQVRAQLRGHRVASVGEPHDVLGPTADEQGVLEHLDAAGQHAEAAISMLPAMAVRTLKDRLTPECEKALELRQLVDHARAEQHAPRLHVTARQGSVEVAALAANRLDPRVAHLDVRVPLELRPRHGPKLRWRRAIAADEILHVLRRGVAWRSCVTQEHVFPPATEGERRGQPRGATADNQEHRRSCRASSAGGARA